MRDQRGSLDERAFNVLLVLPLRCRSCISITLFHQEETVISVRGSSREKSRRVPVNE
jgi:hypothetical protein